MNLLVGLLEEEAQARAQALGADPITQGGAFDFHARDTVLM